MFIFSKILIVFASISFAASNSCSFSVKIKQILHNEGFHSFFRNLTYNIEFLDEEDEPKPLFRSCVVGLDQTLPAGVFANPDELGDLRRVNKVNAIPKNPVNIESSAEQSSPTSVYVVGKVLGAHVNLWMPVHARYHKAAAGGGQTRTTLPPPRLHLKCPDARLDACDPAVARPVTFLCSSSLKDKCNWKEIQYVMITDTPFWDVPIGNTDHYRVVSIGTALVITVGSMYVLKAILDYKNDNDKKYD
ncbi:hypothetical protein JYU34_006187 [Plutella xylostella]|uniref:Phosphatidylinositol-glycan biosynthesis class X protein n=1 Tax=Plutella xylostella TaxID=51655 RepID=A0ABQ7QV82_PLUXY|nr:hypothetical protein JYU34_006187 [Plutella xylostella]